MQWEPPCIKSQHSGNGTSTISYNCVGLIHSRISNNWKTFEYFCTSPNRQELEVLVNSKGSVKFSFPNSWRDFWLIELRLLRFTIYIMTVWKGKFNSNHWRRLLDLMEIIGKSALLITINNWFSKYKSILISYIHFLNRSTNLDFISLCLKSMKISEMTVPCKNVINF